MLFCAPQIQRGLQLVVPQSFNSLDDLRGKAMAVRDLGRPHRITLWLRKVGLEDAVKTVIVPDKKSAAGSSGARLLAASAEPVSWRRFICQPP